MSVLKSVIQYPASRTKRAYSVPVTDENGELPDGVGLDAAKVFQKSDFTEPVEALSAILNKLKVLNFQIATITGNQIEEIGD